LRIGRACYLFGKLIEPFSKTLNNLRPIVLGTNPKLPTTLLEKLSAECLLAIDPSFSSGITITFKS
jgi:hypothetical protein